MKNLFTILACMMITSAFAETAGNVEYQLPAVAKNWKVGNKMENEKGITVVYIPENVERRSANEFFGVNANHMKSDLNDISGLKDSLSKVYYQMDIDFQVLDKAPDSVLYEWSAKEKGQEKIHGFGRAFSTKDGTVVLGYQTKDISGVPQAKDSWLPALKDAKTRYQD